MKMAGFLVSVTVLSALIATVVSKCTFGPSPVYPISEEAPGNTTILNFTKEAGDTVSFSVQKPNQTLAVKALQESLGIVEENTTVHLQTTKKLDLERFWLDYQADITSTIVTITCTGAQSSTVEITIAVTPVNEFAPVFLKGPYNLSLPESTSLMTTVFSLKDKVSDQDHGEQPNFVFSINPYMITDLDGREFFSIPTSTKGDIVVSKALDYDKPAIRHVMHLNLSVADSGGLKVFTTLEVNITDVDDQPPYFDFPNCAKPCPVPPFMAITELDYKGPLQIIPVAIRGLDDDTLGTQLHYVIDSGNDKGLFSMDVNSGVVTQLKSVNEAGSLEAEFRLVIKVRKNITAELQSLAILTVKVRERMSNDTGYLPPLGKSTETPGTPMGLLIPMIIIGVLLVIAVVALVVVTIIYRRNKLGMSVKPTDDKSEPQTEEEDLHTEGEYYIGRADSNEKLVFGNKTTLGIMTDLPATPEGRANRLAPLPFRDTGTETEGKKKRSRKKKKQREPEIFDGTKEYNMGLDAEFFDSTDKSKVKRSQRSKKADSSQPITVPNDNPPDEGSIYN